jgi:hypothetical protein
MFLKQKQFLLHRIMYILAYYNASVVNVVNAAKGLAQALSHHH